MTERELMQMALDALITAELDGNCEYGATDALRARLAQPEQEPINYEEWRFNPMTGEPLWGKQPEPEPVAWWHDMGDVVDLNVSGRGTPLYTAPPQREWQGLTEYEVGFLTVFDGLHDVEVPLLANFIRHIEAKLKEKNAPDL